VRQSPAVGGLISKHQLVLKIIVVCARHEIKNHIRVNIGAWVDNGSMNTNSSMNLFRPLSFSVIALLLTAISLSASVPRAEHPRPDAFRQNWVRD
jgi:hypothetical protein